MGWVGLVWVGSGWVEIFQFLVGWVHNSISIKILQDYVNAFKARSDKIWLHETVKFVSCIGWVGLCPNFPTYNGLGWVGSVS